MDYEKAYNKALERAKKIHGQTEFDYEKGMMEEIFPELGESEDEKIRKELIDYINRLTATPDNIDIYNSWIAWLEKQGEKEEPQTYDTGDGDIITYSETDGYKAVEPKFKIGDWVIRSAEGFKHNAYRITEVKDYYVCEELKGRRVTFTFNDVHNNFKLWDISDAKDGDVLATSAGAFIYNGNNGGGSCPGCYCGIDTLGNFRIGVEYHWTGKPVFPATKEQRDLLFKKMKEEGYEWNAEKKELKKIEQPKLTEFEDEIKDMMDDYRDAIDENDATIEEVKEHAAYLLSLIPCKHAWSVEDSSKVQRICQYLDEAKKYYADITEVRECVEWLKSLEDRVQPKPTEWSDEDEENLQNCCGAIGAADYYTYDDKQEMEKWLLQLKERLS